MAFSNLLKESVLISERAGLIPPGISEDESCFIQNSDFIAIFELSSHVSPKYSVIDECAIRRQILDNSNGFTIIILCKDQAVSI
jgi:hypothetical protein